jgi:hypothetical protein
MAIGKDSGVSDKKQTKRDDPAQSKAFIEKAREIGADEDKSAVDELMKRLAKKPPEPKRHG